MSGSTSASGLCEVVGAQLAHREDRSIASTRLRGTAPSRRTSNEPSSSIARSGRPPWRACRAARRRRGSRPRRRARPRRRRPRAAPRPRPSVRARLQDGPAHRAQRSQPARPAAARASRAPRAYRRRRAGSGARGSAAAASRRRAAAARARRGCAAGQLGQRRQRELELEEHDRGGPIRPAPLERVEPRHPLARVGLGGEPVDGVGGKQRDAANGDAALEASRPPRRVTATPAPTVDASASPARSERTRGERNSALIASVCAGACSSASRIPAGRLRPRASGSRPARRRPRHSASRGSHSADLGRQPLPLVLPHVGQVRHDQVVARPAGRPR